MGFIYFCLFSCQWGGIVEDDRYVLFNLIVSYLMNKYWDKSENCSVSYFLILKACH